VSRSLAPLLALLAMGACSMVVGSRPHAELVVRSTFFGSRQGSAHVVLESRAPRLGWPRVAFFGHAGPAPLRAAAGQLALCGQGRHDPLEVRILVDEWPWEVRVLEATPGAEACVEAVLSQLPLDGSPGVARYVAARVTVADLEAPRTDEVDPPECTLTYETAPRIVGNLPERLPRPGEIAHRVSCADTSPTTDLTVRYARGALVEARTEPEVPCVEARARAALSRVTDLNLPYAPSAWWPASLEGFDAVTCTVTVPLRAR